MYNNLHFLYKISKILITLVNLKKQLYNILLL